ncbi:PTS system cellobiose-specific IIB component [Streptococcus rupicaprae]|uniref:PTS system cellobiose-specific IIB component n=1 Tax=Streptococcus rupicaprae TaxID=759619 RepID=A0ABV2FIZ9_9STRE
MAKEVLLMCAGGMSSSLMAKKVTAYLAERGQDILVTARGVGHGKAELEKSAAYDLYLLSPQVRMYFEALDQLAKKKQKELVQVPGPAYVPVPKGIALMADLILEGLGAKEMRES